MGAVVAVVAIIALRSPNGHSASAGGTTIYSTQAPSTPAPSSTSSRPSSASASSSSSSSSSSSTSTATSSSATADAKSVPLIVLNDSTVTGLAADTAQTFKTDGWTVTDSGNLPSGITDIASTCAYYDPSVAGAEAAAQALQTQYPGIKRVKERFDGLPSGPVVVVLTDTLSTT